MRSFACSSTFSFDGSERLRRERRLGEARAREVELDPQLGLFRADAVFVGAYRDDAGLVLDAVSESCRSA